RRERCRRRHDAGLRQIELIESAHHAISHVELALIRREADSVRRDELASPASDLRAVGAGVIDRAEPAILTVRVAEAGEPKSAGAVKYQIVRTVERAPLAVVVQGGERAAPQVDPLNESAAVPGRRSRRQMHIARRPFPRATVVADVGRSVRPDRGAVGPTAELRDGLSPPIGSDAREGAAPYLDEDDRSIAESDGTFGELEAGCDELGTRKTVG